MPPTRPPYAGATRKLVLAFDIGTTYSGISYSILDPGQVPEIKGVTRFPAQEKVGGDSKIPTIIYYDKGGKVRAVGAEAEKDSIKFTIEEEGWIKAAWFKLHMRPKSISTDAILRSIPPLPKNKSVVQLFADFMRYLYACAKSYIEESHANGISLWTSVEGNIEFVLTHPNGWEGAQQQQMRDAALLANLVPSTPEGQARIHFVTEGEASLHFCITKGLTTEALKDIVLKKGGGILIVDAGGGTVDVSAYGQAAGDGAFEEIAAAQCHLQGSVFVTSRARAFLEDYLKGSKFFDDINVPNGMVEIFDKKSKLTFDKSANPLFIQFGSARDKDPKLNIRAGQLKLLGTDVAKFFDPSVTCITQAVLAQCKSARKTISSVFLVGGFSASEYLFSGLKESLKAEKLDICRPDSHVNKAVADGAVSFYLDHSVKTRVAKFSYGTDCATTYRKDDAEHRSRSHRTFIGLYGRQMLAKAFSIILPKDVQVSETQEFRETYTLTRLNPTSDQHISEPILCYRGTIEKPRFTDVDEAMYSTLCHVEADIPQSQWRMPLLAFMTGFRTPIYEAQFDMVLSFGLTELKAAICWTEDGQEKRGPAKIVYDVEEKES